jgi:hypothetical protein
MNMDIGKPIRELEITPEEDPVPRDPQEPAPAEAPLEEPAPLVPA